MPSIKGVRERARAEITAEIIAEARRQLATVGASGLSLRAIARELGMVSSGIYRYVASRDALLTLLIVDAYDALGATAEQAATDSDGEAPAERWLKVARTIRTWALEHPHEYALLYGTPVPGYEAPSDTIDPASRAPLALLGIVVAARRDGRLVRRPAAPAGDVLPLHRELATRLGELGIDLTPDLMIVAVAAWSQLFGMITFELFGQTYKLVDAHDQLFDATAASMASFVGLEPA